MKFLCVTTTYLWEDHKYPITDIKKVECADIEDTNPHLQYPVVPLTCPARKSPLVFLTSNEDFRALGFTKSYSTARCP